MKFLVDQCLSPVLESLLSKAGHDAIHVRDRKMEHAADPEILALGESEDRTILSADSDFGNILTIGTKRKPSLILFRGDFEPAAHEQARLLLDCLPKISGSLSKGAIVVVTRTKLRIRKL